MTLWPSSWNGLLPKGQEEEAGSSSPPKVGACGGWLACPLLSVSMERARALLHVIKVRLCSNPEPDTPEEREGMMTGDEVLGDGGRSRGGACLLLVLDWYMDRRKRLLGCLKVSSCAVRRM